MARLQAAIAKVKDTGGMESPEEQVSEVLQHASKGYFAGNAQEIDPWYIHMFWNYWFKITDASPRGQWVKCKIIPTEQTETITIWGPCHYRNFALLVVKINSIVPRQS